MFSIKELTGFMTAAELAAYLKCSETKAYRVIRKVNEAEEAKGHQIIRGRVSELLLARYLGLIDDGNTKVRNKKVK